MRMNTENMNQNADPASVQGTGERTFTQDDVNRIVQDRLAKDREKASKELGEREQELAQREFRLNSRQKLADKGYPETLLDALNCSSEEAFDKALGIIDGLMEERLKSKKDDEKQAQLEAQRAKPFTGPLNQSSYRTGADPIRKAMNLN
jgi:hypothetical protein